MLTYPQVLGKACVRGMDSGAFLRSQETQICSLLGMPPKRNSLFWNPRLDGLVQSNRSNVVADCPLLCHILSPDVWQLVSYCWSHLQSKFRRGTLGNLLGSWTACHANPILLCNCFCMLPRLDPWAGINHVSRLMLPLHITASPQWFSCKDPLQQTQRATCP